MTTSKLNLNFDRYCKDLNLRIKKVFFKLLLNFSIFNFPARPENGLFCRGVVRAGGTSRVWSRGLGGMSNRSNEAARSSAERARLGSGGAAPRGVQPVQGLYSELSNLSGEVSMTL